MDLFSLFLSSFAGGAIRWGIGRILDVITRCPTCSQRDELHIGNVQFNDIECTNCHKHLHQYTNACDFTIDPESRQIGHAVAWKAEKGWEWKSGGFFDPKLMLWVPWRVRLEGLHGRSVVVSTVVTDYEEDEETSSHMSVINVDSKMYLGRISHGYPKSLFDDTDSRIFSVDIELLSEYHDVLFEDRRIINPFK